MATSKKPAVGSDPPKWIAVVGAIVAVGGLAYTWYSHFNPIVEPTKPRAEAPPSTQTAASVSVSGSGAVGIGVMHGGTINVGAPAAAVAPGNVPSAASPVASVPKN